MITKQELIDLQEAIKYIIDDQYEELYEEGGDSLVFTTLRAIIEDDIANTGTQEFAGLKYSNILKTLDKIIIIPNP